MNDNNKQFTRLRNALLITAFVILIFGLISSAVMAFWSGDWRWLVITVGCFYLLRR